jgi:hypothetical protein
LLAQLTFLILSIKKTPEFPRPAQFERHCSNRSVQFVTVFNLLQSRIYLNCVERSKPYRSVNTPHLDLKKKIIIGKYSLFVLRSTQNIQVYCVGRRNCECEVCWNVKQPVGFEGIKKYLTSVVRAAFSAASAVFTVYTLRSVSFHQF